MPLILTEEALFKTPEASRPRSMSEWAQIWAQSRSHQRPIVGIDRHVLVESRGLESATLRVNAGRTCIFGSIAIGFPSDARRKWSRVRVNSQREKGKKRAKSFASTCSPENGARNLLILKDLAPRAGLEPATLRLTAEIDAVCWTLPHLAALAESCVRPDERGLNRGKRLPEFAAIGRPLWRPKGKKRARFFRSAAALSGTGPWRSKRPRKRCTESLSHS